MSPLRFLIPLLPLITFHFPTTASGFIDVNTGEIYLQGSSGSYYHPSSGSFITPGINERGHFTGSYFGSNGFVYTAATDEFGRRNGAFLTTSGRVFSPDTFSLYPNVDPVIFRNGEPVSRNLGISYPRPLPGPTRMGVAEKTLQRLDVDSFLNQIQGTWQSECYYLQGFPVQDSFFFSGNHVVQRQTFCYSYVQSVETALKGKAIVGDYIGTQGARVLTIQYEELTSVPTSHLSASELNSVAACEISDWRANKVESLLGKNCYGAISHPGDMKHGQIGIGEDGNLYFTVPQKFQTNENGRNNPPAINFALKFIKVRM